MPERDELHRRFREVREQTEALCEPLCVEDYVVQSMEDASPVKWNIAHTTWYFETFVLEAHLPGWRPHDPAYRHLFNSYYQAVGPQFDRPRRGVLSRPTVDDVWKYRRAVDAAVHDLIGDADEATLRDLGPLVEIGINHEEQHQELLLTDLKHAFAQNPLHPAYANGIAAYAERSPPSRDATVAMEGGVVNVGFEGDGFAYDNEGPAHRVFLEDFRIARDLVTNRWFREFLEDGGYGRHDLWLSDGWATVQARGWQAPLYWENVDGVWHSSTLRGFEPIDLDAPVVHVSHYEADAFARWADARLPTEAEWETVTIRSHDDAARGGLLSDGRYHPDGRPTTGEGPRHLIGEVWEWTASAYLPYPGYRPIEGALGEYNGKFMSGQMVLRGGSCATPEGHVRPTYRNFFQPDKRWQLSGVRLAWDVGS